MACSLSLVLLSAVARTVSAQAGDHAASVAIRAADRRTIIVLLTRDLPATVPPTVLALLSDTKTATVIPVQPDTVTCPRAPGLRPATHPRLCVAVARGASLDDSRGYTLQLSLISATTLGPDTVALGTVNVPPVGGQIVLSDKEGASIVRILYTLDLSQEGVDPVIQMRGSNVLRNPRRIAELPLCYAPNEYEFNCPIADRVNHGDVVTASLVNRATGVQSRLPQPKSATGKYEIAQKEDDARFVAKGNYSRGKEAAWSTDLLIQNVTFWELGGGAHRYSGGIGPYLHAAVSSDTADPGTWNLGGQARLTTIVMNSLVDYLRLDFLSHVESNKDNSVQHWLVADATVGVGFPYIGSGRLWGGGNYSFIPAVGFEAGRTLKGEKVVRLERNNPRRLKTGLTAHLGWPKAVTTLPAFLANIPLEGVSLDASANFYCVQLSDSSRTLMKSGNPISAKASFTYRISRVVGLTAAWRNGKAPPIFDGHSVIELGSKVMF